MIESEYEQLEDLFVAHRMFISFIFPVVVSLSFRHRFLR